MLFLENIILAVTGLLSNKIRTFLTMLGIIIGIGSVIAIITVGNALTLSVSEKMQSMGANDVYVIVQPKKQEEEEGKIDGVKYGKLETATEVSSQDYITPEMISQMCEKFSDEVYAINIELQMGTTQVSVNKNTVSATLSGVTAGYFVTNEKTMIAGHMFSQNDFESGKNVIIVSDKFVENAFDGDNKKAVGSEIEINDIGKFSIVGVYEYEENYMMGMSTGNGVTPIYMPMKTTIAFPYIENAYPYVQVVTKVGVDTDLLSTKIKNFFEPYYRNNHNCEIKVITLSSMTSMLTEMLGTITLAISIVAGIALIVGGIGVMNIMLVSITERTREIGTRKALGATNGSIRIQFIVEAMIICLIGGVFGVILGVSGGILLSKLLGYPASPSIPGIIISLIFSMTIGVFFGYYPANKAAKMNPIDALRYE